MTQARQCGCGRDCPAGPQVCPTSRLQLGAWPEARPSRAWGRCPPGRFRREFPRGRVLSRRIPGMPPGRGDRSQPLRPGASCPLREAGAPAHAGGLSPAGRVWPRRPSPRAPPQSRQALGPRPTRPPRCPGAAPRVTRARKPPPLPPPGPARGWRPAEEPRWEAHSTEALMAQGPAGVGGEGGRGRGTAEAWDQSVWRS